MRGIGRQFGTIWILMFIAGAAHSAAPGAPQASPLTVESHAEHRIQLLDTSALALTRILEMVSRAEREIILEYNGVHFCSWVGQILFNKLQERIRNRVPEVGQASGLRVRLLIDYYDFYTDNPGVGRAGVSRAIQLLKARGIEVRFFNPTPLLGPLGMLRFNMRDHQKRLIVDGNEMILGGRLLGSQYFGKGSRFNRLEKDIWVRGPIVTEASRHFERIWNHELSMDRFDGDVSTLSTRENEWFESFRACLGPWEMLEDDRDSLRLAAARDAARNPERIAHALAMGLDYPGHLTKAASFVPWLNGKIADARREFLTEQQYFLPSADLERSLRKAAQAGARIRILSNSYVSGDDPLIEALTLDRAMELNRAPGFEISLFRGRLPVEHPGIWRAGQEGTRWQIHGKAWVLDRKTSWIGSNNFDPRSEWLNLETGILVQEHPEFAKDLADSIEGNLANSVRASESEKELDSLIEPLASRTAWERAKIRFKRFGAEIMAIFM